jgi:hypothetical protein
LIFHCARPTRAFRFHMPFLEGVAEAALYCAHRTSTFLSCAFCEQEGHLAILSRLSKLPRYLSRDGALLIFHCARPTRAFQSSISLCLSIGEWPRLPFTARIERPLFHRGGSASKKGTRPLPSILLRPRVARAQKIIRLHPLLCSASSRTTRLPFPSFFSSRLSCEPGCLPIDHPHSSKDQCDAEDFAHAH